MTRTVHIKTKLLGPVIAVEERADATTGEVYLVDEKGAEWILRPDRPIRAHDLEPKGR